MLAKPRQHAKLELSGQGEHLFSFGGGDQAGALVGAVMALPSKLIQLLDQGRIGADGVSEALDDTIVVRLTGCPVPGCCQSGGSHLQRRVVGDIQAPVGVQSWSVAGGNVTLRQGQQIGDLSPARAVRRQPSPGQPVAQGHLGLR